MGGSTERKHMFLVRGKDRGANGTPRVGLETYSHRGLRTLTFYRGGDQCLQDEGLREGRKGETPDSRVLLDFLISSMAENHDSGSGVGWAINNQLFWMPRAHMRAPRL